MRKAKAASAAAVTSRGFRIGYLGPGGLPAVMRAMPAADQELMRQPFELLAPNNPLMSYCIRLQRAQYRSRAPALELPGGIRSRVPFAEYRQLPGMSISRLKRMKRSPLHFLHEPTSTPALQLGSAAHCKVLEPDLFGCQYRIWNRRSDSGRAAPRSGKIWDLFEAQAAADDFDVLTVEQAEHAEAIARAVRSDKAAMRYLAAGEPEVTMQWEMQGRACKARPDWLTFVDNGPVLVGLKTTRDCRPFYFGRQAADLEYAQYWAWYFNGYYTLTGVKPKIVEIVVENTAPYAVAVYVIGDDILFKGEEEYGKQLVQYDACEASGRWPGPLPQETELTLPGWYFGEQLGDLAGLGLAFE